MSEQYSHNRVLGPRRNVRMGVNGHSRGSSRAGSGATDDAGLDFSAIFNAIREGKWIVLVTCLVVAGGITAYTLMLPKKYSARALTLVASREGGEFMQVAQGRSISNELSKLRYSGELITAVASELTAVSDALEERPSPTTFPVLYDEDGKLLDERGLTRAIAERVEFRPQSGQDMIVIQATSTVPEEAARIANIYAEEYREYSRETSRAQMRAARGYLEEQVERRREELDEINAQIVAFERRNETVTRGPGGERLVAEFTRYRALRDEYELQRSQEEQRLETLRAELKRIEPDLEKRMAANIEVQSLQTQLNEFSQRIGQLQLEIEEYYLNDGSLRGNEERIPELAALIRRKDGLESQREKLVNQLAQKTIQTGSNMAMSGDQLNYVAQVRTNIIDSQGKIQGLAVQIESLDRKLASYEDDLRGIPTLQIERSQLVQKRELLQKFYTNFLQQLQSTRIAEESELGHVEIVQQAYVPTVPVSPDVKQNVVLGIVLGLGLGMGLAFVWQATNGYIKRPEDLQEHGYTVVGIVPSMDKEIKASYGGKEHVEVNGRRVSTRLVTLLNPWSPIVENFRLVRTNIQHADAWRQPKTLLVTSPQMGEGKSVVAVNTAISMASNGSRTLLIDADIRRPTAHSLLGLDKTPGLSNLLHEGGEPQLDDLESGIDNLSFLGAGDGDVPPVELLASREMTRLLDKAKRAFDVIIVDSPPLLAVSDPVVLASQVDATLVVVAARQTEMPALDAAVETLSGVGVEPAGIVLNKYDTSKTHGYAYGYGYSYSKEYVNA